MFLCAKIAVQSSEVYVFFALQRSAVRPGARRPGALPRFRFYVFSISTFWSIAQMVIFPRLQKKTSEFQSRYRVK